MFDLGLGQPGTPSHGAGSEAGKGKGWGEVEVQWGKERFNITGVPPDHQKLIYSGALLKDDLAPLSSFDLVDSPQPSVSSSEQERPSKPTSFWDTWSFNRPNHQRKLKKLVMLGSKDVSAKVDDRLMNRADLLPVGADEIVPIKAVSSEPEVVAKIDVVAKTKLEELIPQLETVEKWIDDRQAEKPNPRSLVFLSEALLQALLKLDSIEVQSGYTEARAARKLGVKELQAALDRVDALKPKFKKALEE